MLVDDVVPCCRGNSMKSVETLAFVGSSEPVELDRHRCEDGEVSPCFPTLSILQKEEMS